MDHLQEATYSSADSASYREARSSGVSWAAVAAGAFATAALALILLSLGSGLGLSSVSFWSGEGLSASTLGTAAILWLIFMEIVSSAMGGYLAGRLRTKWTTVHSDEVYFRDTAHGLLAWSVALVISAAFLGAAATSLVGSSMPSSQAAKSSGNELNAYYVDSLFRGDVAKPESVSASRRAEAAVIFATSLKAGALSSSDKTYLDQVVSADTGLSASDADKRVTDSFANAQQAAETARKALAHTLLWMFISLLIGAFSASVAATIGGRQRDAVRSV